MPGARQRWFDSPNTDHVHRRSAIVPAGPLDLGMIIGGASCLLRFAPAVTVGFPIAAVLIGIGVPAALFHAFGLDHPRHGLPVVIFFVIVCALWVMPARTVIGAVGFLPSGLLALISSTGAS